MKRILFLLCLMTLGGCGITQNGESFSVPKLNNTNILALGDSITAGYGVSEAENYPAKLQTLLDTNKYTYTLINSGISGETSSDLLTRVEEMMQNPENIPGIAILVIGGNDGLRQKDVGKMKENIEKTIDILTQKNVVVVLGGMQLNFLFGLEYSKEFKQAYYDIAQEKKVYFFEDFLAGVRGKYKLNLPDNIHPNSLGYEIISQRIFDFLVENKLVTQ